MCLSAGFSRVWSVTGQGRRGSEVQVSVRNVGGKTKKRFLDGCIPAANISTMRQASLSEFEHADVDFSQKTGKKQIFLCF